MKKFDILDAFYQGYFLPGHRHKYTKLCHFLAIAFAILFGSIFLVTAKPIFPGIAVLSGYGLSIISHYLFEKNKPATYEYPWYSFLSAFRLFFETLTGKHRIF